MEILQFSRILDLRKIDKACSIYDKEVLIT